jgi:hypothetical protein
MYVDTDSHENVWTPNEPDSPFFSYVPLPQHRIQKFGVRVATGVRLKVDILDHVLFASEVGDEPLL